MNKPRLQMHAELLAEESKDLCMKLDTLIYKLEINSDDILDNDEEDRKQLRKTMKEVRQQCQKVAIYL